MNPLPLAYLLLALFMGTERYLRQGQQARSLQTGAADQGSTRRMGAAHGVALLTLLLAPMLGRIGIGRYPAGKRVGWAGVGMMILGFGLRVWANRTLGEFYTRTLRVSEGQRLVDAGPYQVVRHPGYLGALLFWLGAGLATGNWLAALVIALAMPLAYGYRIQSEEAMLSTSFAEHYKAYCQRTWRLVPFLF